MAIKMILDYQCIMATTDYHGRKWAVWFTTEIPMQDGPWKFCGLPGLVMEASEPSGQHGFIATGVETNPQPSYPLFSTKYETMDGVYISGIGNVSVAPVITYYHKNTEIHADFCVQIPLPPSNAHKSVQAISTQYLKFAEIIKMRCHLKKLLICSIRTDNH